MVMGYTYVRISCCYSNENRVHSVHRFINSVATVMGTVYILPLSAFGFIPFLGNVVDYIFSACTFYSLTNN